MTAEPVSSRGKDNKQHLDENRLTLTQAAEPLSPPHSGANGGDRRGAPTKGPRGTERVGDQLLELSHLVVSSVQLPAQASNELILFQYGGL